MAYIPTLKTTYKEQIVPALMKEFGYKSIMQVPKLQKIVLNEGVGEAVAEMLRPIREEAQRILKDKAYLESVYKMGAEKAAYAASKTLRKVYKKIGFVQR